MSDVSWCQKCGTYHAPLTACPLPLSTDCISPTYRQTGTTTVDLDGMRAEIARLKAERDEYRAALKGIVKLKSDSWDTSEKMYEIAKQALAGKE